MNDVKKVPALDAQYIRDHCATMSVTKMARALGRSNATLYEFMGALGLEPLKRTMTENHPFKIKNRKLATELLARRIQKGQK